MGDSLFENIMAENDKEIEDRAREKYEWQRLIEVAADFIGCEDKSMWSIGVIEAALHHANFTRREWESCLAIIRQKDAEIFHLNYKLEAKLWEVQALDRETKRLREALVSVRLCESLYQANQIAKEALAKEDA